MSGLTLNFMFSDLYRTCRDIQTRDMDVAVEPTSILQTWLEYDV